MQKGLTFADMQSNLHRMTRNDFISIWGSMAALARAIGESETTVRHWFRRGSIPVWHDRKIIESAREIGRTITHDDMFDLRQDIAQGCEDAA